MKSKSYLKQIEEYQIKYGNIPLKSEEILKYLEKELKLTDKDFQKIDEMNNYADNLPWETLKIILPIIPKPTPRPRQSSNGHFYVKGAAENKKLFKYYFNKKYRIIYTQTYFSMEAYLPTPLSIMNRLEIYRAEEKKIRPPSNPDFDNLLKTYSDMIQGQLLLNDNIITTGICDKFYSIKPRVEITIDYQLGYDSKFNKKRIENSTAYKRSIETGHIIEIYTEGDAFW